jgi:hypothetical protein
LSSEVDGIGAVEGGRDNGTVDDGLTMDDAEEEGLMIGGVEGGGDGEETDLKGVIRVVVEGGVGKPDEVSVEDGGTGNPFVEGAASLNINGSSCARTCG